MTKIFQIIALNLFGLSALQIIAAIGITVMLLQVVVKRLSISSWWKARKENKEIEDNMWAIE